MFVTFKPMAPLEKKKKKEHLPYFCSLTGQFMRKRKKILHLNIQFAYKGFLFFFISHKTKFSCKIDISEEERQTGELRSKWISPTFRFKGQGCCRLVLCFQSKAPEFFFQNSGKVCEQEKAKEFFACSLWDFKCPPL